MESLNKPDKLDNEKKQTIFFTRKAHDDLKNYDKAFNSLNEANKLRYKKFGSNRKKKLFKNIIKTFESIDFEKQ